MLWIAFFEYFVTFRYHAEESMPERSPTIPRILHYTWLTDREKPPEVVKRIESWYKHCRGWLIVEWNAFSLPRIHNKYISQASRANYWPFLDDYVGLYALLHYGGVYIDSDVELLRPLDELLNATFFLGQEVAFGYYTASTHIIGAVPHNEIIGDILSECSKEDMFDTSGLPNYYTPSARFCQYFLNKFGVDATLELNNTVLTHSSYLYPWWYFYKENDGYKSWAIQHTENQYKNENQKHRERTTIVLDETVKNHFGPVNIIVLLCVGLALGLPMHSACT